MAELDRFTRARLGRIADRALAEAGVAGVLATPLEELQRAAGITARRDIAELPAELATPGRELLGALWFERREVFVDVAQPEPRRRFTDAHEAMHALCPWHEAVLREDTDAELFRDTSLAIEAEANHGAGLLIFQGRRFAEKIAGAPRYMATVLALAEEHRPAPLRDACRRRAGGRPARGARRLSQRRRRVRLGAGAAPALPVEPARRRAARVRAPRRRRRAERDDDGPLRLARLGDAPGRRAAVRARRRRIARHGAHELSFALQLVDAVGAGDELARLARFLPPSGELPVPGGLADEKLRPLDHSAAPGPLRRHIAAEAIERDLERPAAEQRDDGGWEIDFAAASPAAALEWHGYVTVHAVKVLRANGH